MSLAWSRFETVPPLGSSPLAALARVRDYSGMIARMSDVLERRGEVAER